jgi:hypothetical protein
MEGVELSVMVVLIDRDIDDERDAVDVCTASTFQRIGKFIG